MFFFFHYPPVIVMPPPIDHDTSSARVQQLFEGGVNVLLPRTGNLNGYPEYSSAGYFLHVVDQEFIGLCWTFENAEMGIFVFVSGGLSMYPWDMDWSGELIVVEEVPE